MLSHNREKYIRSLRLSKYRWLEKKFIVEGRKNTRELLMSSLPAEEIYAVPSWIEENPDLTANKNINVIEVNEKQLKKISELTTPDQVLAIARIPEKPEEIVIPVGKSVIMLDGIRDPGNMGTIIRTADWFGIRHIICSTDCVDVYSPKVVQATMGSFCRVSVKYENLAETLDKLPNDIPVYGALLKGPPLHELNAAAPGIILIGNESKGISVLLMKYINQPVYIPSFSAESQNENRAESLNASVANAIICYEICKQLFITKS